MKLQISIFACALTLLLEGCVIFSSQPTYPPVELQTKFVGAEHKDYATHGNFSVKGRTTLHNDNGGIVNCSGNEVFLLPATPFFREIVSHIKKGHKISYEKYLPSSHNQIVKKTKCDTEGNFSFSNLPVCSWFIVTRTVWELAGLPQGGTLVREIKTCPESPLILDNVDIAGP